ncbi:hypothetical protein E4T56_gene11803 [Termitomyces sp. T112]|nr:hypothetical protein E4T56_gene11803 [Termitomyces sp. T112]
MRINHLATEATPTTLFQFGQESIRKPLRNHVGTADVFCRVFHPESYYVKFIVLECEQGAIYIYLHRIP